jgi:hypothetical protein
MNQITLSENVMVSDPCYTPDTWCQTKLTNVLPGKYNVDVQKSDEGSWGTRVSSITVIHEDYDDTDDWEQHSECGVDSGQCGVFCMTSYRNDEMSEGITTPDVNFNLSDYRKDDGGEKWYEKMCRFTLSENQWGLYDTGVVTSSGIGDGLYPMDVMMDGDKIVGIRLEYLGNSDEDLLDEDEDEGDCCDECGAELESDGSCDYCEHFENSKNED